MHSYIKLLASIAAAFSLSACTTTGSKVALSENLSIAPAIDVAYSEVIENIPENIGVNVRWGGRILGSKKVGDHTELTVSASPLGDDSRPIQKSSDGFKGGRFIVVVPQQERTLITKYITVYGKVDDQRTLVNGPKTQVIPVVTAIETQDWAPEAREPVRGNAFYSLGYHTGHFNSFRGFSHRSFGHRGFGRFARSYHRQNFGYGYRYNRNDFFNSRFGRAGFFSRGH